MIDYFSTKRRKEPLMSGLARCIDEEYPQKPPTKCESSNHAQYLQYVEDCRREGIKPPYSIYSIYWQCPRCKRKICSFCEGTTDHPDLCDECWAKKYWKRRKNG